MVWQKKTQGTPVIFNIFNVRYMSFCSRTLIIYSIYITYVVPYHIYYTTNVVPTTSCTVFCMISKLIIVFSFFSQKQTLHNCHDIQTRISLTICFTRCHDINPNPSPWAPRRSCPPNSRLLPLFNPLFSRLRHNMSPNLLPLPLLNQSILRRPHQTFQ